MCIERESAEYLPAGYFEEMEVQNLVAETSLPIEFARLVIAAEDDNDRNLDPIERHNERVRNIQFLLRLIRLFLIRGLIQ